jgi:hypothetical protein
LTGREELALIAELGIAFAGFLAIFLIFARREGRFSPADSLRVRSIIVSSLSAVFLALLPLAIHLYGMEDARLWRTSSIVALTVGVLMSVHVGRKQYALPPEDRAEVGFLHSNVAWGLVLVSGLLLASNILGVFREPSAAPYIASLICALGIATSNFVTIAFHRLL